MITIHHLNNSRSERIIWLMEELGLPYAIDHFDRRPDNFAPESLQRAHPLGRAPAIRDGELVLAESGAIVEYIIARHGNGRLSVAPAEPHYADYLYWLHYAEGSLMLQLLRESSLRKMVPDVDAHPAMARIRDTTQAHLRFIDDTLAQRPYFAGQAFTAADIMMVFPFTTLLPFLPQPPDLTRLGALKAYLARIGERPAYRKAMALATTPHRQSVPA